MKTHHHPTTHRRKRRAADEASQQVDVREEGASSAQSVELLRQSRVGSAMRGAAALGLQHVIGNAQIARELARCACEEKERVSREISTPLKKDEAIMQKDGSAFLKVANVEVKVLPDTVSKNPKMKGAHTDFTLRIRRPKPTFDKGKLVGLDTPAIMITIQTTYGPKVDPAGISAYGKGTTAEDQQAGTTSLRYHEGSHGLDYIQYIKENPPSLHTSIGMSRGEYQTALSEFNQLMKNYAKNMNNFSKQRTDCVGSTIDQAGFTKKPVCE